MARFGVRRARCAGCLAGIPYRVHHAVGRGALHAAPVAGQPFGAHAARRRVVFLPACRAHGCLSDRRRPSSGSCGRVRLGSRGVGRRGPGGHRDRAAMGRPRGRASFRGGFGSRRGRGLHLHVHREGLHRCLGKPAGARPCAALQGEVRACGGTLRLVGP